MREAGLQVCGGCGTPGAVEAIEYRGEQLFTVFDDIIEWDAAAFDIGFIHVDRNSGHISNLLREENPAGDENGTEGE